MDNQKNSSKQDQYHVLKVAGLIAFILWLGNLVFGVVTSACGEFGARLGDSFGSINALFSSIAVAGAIYAVILQQKQFAASESRERQLADLQAVSAYSQCLASCAQLTMEKYKDAADRIQKSSKVPNPPKLSKTEPNEFDQLLKEYEKRINEHVEKHEIELTTMASYFETTNQLITDLTVAMESLRGFPSVAAKISDCSKPDSN